MHTPSELVHGIYLVKFRQNTGSTIIFLTPHLIPVGEERDTIPWTISWTTSLITSLITSLTRDNNVQSLSVLKELPAAANEYSGSARQEEVKYGDWMALDFLALGHKTCEEKKSCPG